jgi:hypothetical protein
MAAPSTSGRSSPKEQAQAQAELDRNIEKEIVRAKQTHRERRGDKDA